MYTVLYTSKYSSYLILSQIVKGGVASTSIAVIAPYREQVSLLRRSTPVEVSTVDQFQGRDKSVVLYCCTKSDEGQDAVKVIITVQDNLNRIILGYKVGYALHKFKYPAFLVYLRKTTKYQITCNSFEPTAKCMANELTLNSSKV